MAIEALIGDVGAFLTSVKAEVAAAGVRIEDRVIDHVCLRVATQEEYVADKEKFLQYGKLLHEANINGRPIATYKLFEPIVHGPHKIWCVELPSPKPGSPYPTGLEHFEVVIDTPFEDFMREHPTIQWDTAAITKEINADIRMPLPSGNSVKFHHDTLENVIALEIKMGL